MFLNLFFYSLRQCFQSLIRNLGLALASAGMVAVSLFLLGSFLLLGINVEQLMRGLETSVEIGVFLEHESGQASPRESVEEEIRHLEGVKSYEFVNREEALATMSQELGDETMLEDLEGEHNPLPDTFLVRAERAELVPELAQEMEGISGVEKTDYGGDLLNWLMALGSRLNLVFLGASGLLAAASIYLVVTSIRLSLLTRAEEVGIMKYLGASNWFIRFPFLLEGMIIGWVGTLLAVGVLATGYYYLANTMQQIDLLFLQQPVTAPSELLLVWLGLLVVGTLIGGIGSLLSLHRFLKV